MSKIDEVFGESDTESSAGLTAVSDSVPNTRVFVPAHPRYPADPTQVPEIGFELLAVANADSHVAVAFSTVEALVEAMGEAQPWVLVRLGWYAEFVHRSGYGRLQLDPVIEPGTARTWTPEAIQEYVGAVR